MFTPVKSVHFTVFDSSLNSDNACRYSLQTLWRVMLWFSEHRRKLAREACLQQLSDGDHLQWNMVCYSTVDTMQQIEE